MSVISKLILSRINADRRRLPPTGRGLAGKRALSRCKGGHERTLLVVIGRVKGPMQIKTTVVVKEGDD